MESKMSQKAKLTLTVLAAVLLTSTGLSSQAAPLAETTTDKFKTDVLTATKPVVVEFSASWCNYCKAMAPTIEGMAKTYQGRAAFFTVDIDKEPLLKAQYKIRALPRVFVFNKGEPIVDTTGVSDGKVITTKLDELVSRIPVVDDNF